MNPGQPAFQVHGFADFLKALANILIGNTGKLGRTEPCKGRLVKENHHRPLQHRKPPCLPAGFQGQELHRGIPGLVVIEDMRGDLVSQQAVAAVEDDDALVELRELVAVGIVGNVENIVSFAVKAEELGVERFVFISSTAVYGVPDKHPLDETDELDKAGVRRVILCSGKVYYDLLQARQARDTSNVALVRVEQLYPFPEQELQEVFSAYPNIKDAVWCQEEPMNQGAWYSSQHHMRRVLFQHKQGVYLHYVGREASAAPAAGYMALHLEQLEAFINEALASEMPSWK